MFVTVKINENLPLGTVIQYDAASQTYQRAVSVDYPLGVIIRDPLQDSESQEWTARACFAGVCYALASEALPDQGGLVDVIDGKVKSSGGDTQCGIIAPRDLNGPSRGENDLVMIHLR